MYVEKCLSLCLLICLNICQCLSFSALGHANIVIERLELCDNAEKYPVVNNLVMKKINRTTSGITGCVRIPEALGPTSSFHLDLSKWGDGGWKPNAYNLREQDVCKLVQKYIKTAYEDMLASSGLKDEGCPLKKRDYCPENFVISLGKLFPSVLYGKFRADVIILIDSKPMFCLRIILTSTPSLI